MGLFAFLSCCGWGVAHSRAPFGESPTGTGESRVLPPKEAAARDAQQSDRDGRAPLSQHRLTATFFNFFRQIAHRGLGA